jgi:hypothetical protein
VKSEAAIRREIKALNLLDTMESSDGLRAEAIAMQFALEWALGKWAMSWSDWLKGCRESNLRILRKSVCRKPSS